MLCIGTYASSLMSVGRTCLICSQYSFTPHYSFIPSFAHLFSGRPTIFVQCSRSVSSFGLNLVSIWSILASGGPWPFSCQMWSQVDPFWPPVAPGYFLVKFDVNLVHFVPPVAPSSSLLPPPHRDVGMFPCSSKGAPHQPTNQQPSAK